jgi:hypothetical protein
MIETASVGARHDRVVLPAQAEIQCDLLVHRPAVAQVHGMLPFAAGEELVLIALARGADETKHERRVGVVEIRRLRAGAERPGRIPGEIESTAWVRPFRLPVVQVQVVETIPESEVVVGHDLRDVAADRCGPLVAIGGRPRW